MTPISMDTMERETHREQTKEGMKIRAMTIMTRAVTNTHWIVWGLIAKYWKESMCYILVFYFNELHTIRLALIFLKYFNN